MNWQECFEDYNLAKEPKRLHSTYEFILPECNSKIIRINIWEFSEGRFMGLSDHSIQNANQAAPYRDIHMYNSPEEALMYSISGITTYVQPPYDQIRFRKDDHF